eukprot:m.110805 g.110805  ORF g.110805 m.110805 type:complete len:196 (-) comp19202_c0_seq8:35-622(-)
MLLTLSVVVLGALLAYYGSSIMGAVNGIVSRTVPTPTVTSFYDLVARDIKGRDVSFTRFRGKVVCVVNVATNCGLTNDNYKELQILHERHSEKGLEIVAFPCNQFLFQEPGSNEEICQRVEKKFQAQFTLMEKVDVNGDNTHPVYAFLKAKTGVQTVSWNFAKFVVSRDENITYYGPKTNPLSMEEDLLKLLRVE